MASTLHKPANNVDNLQPASNTSQQQFNEQQQHIGYVNDAHHTATADNNKNIEEANDENSIKLAIANKTAAHEQLTLATSPTNIGLQQSANSGLGIALMQSSPPPHSYRHSRAYRHFKNPPQPHMCIRTITDSGEEIFINVLSWTRIVIPQEPSDPIPLYGGMRVPPGSPRSPPIVFAVMANPEVLKDSGRHSKDAEERRAMVELMCDFVEAMNPGIKLVRNAVILKDRDISGELKDVWNAVQAQRDREREEQILQQRQQQHYHNITTQQMFPKTNEQTNALQATGLQTTPAATRNATSPPPPHRPSTNADADDENDVYNSMMPKNDMMEKIHENCRVTNYGVTTTAARMSTHDYNATIHNEIIENQNNAINSMESTHNGALNQNNVDADANVKYQQKHQHDNGAVSPGNDQIDAKLYNGHSTDDDDAVKTDSQHVDHNNKTNATNASQSAILDKHGNKNLQQQHQFNVDLTNQKNATNISQTTTASKKTNASQANDSSTPASTTVATTAATTPTPAVVPAAQPTKKDKLGGFLPNGCIFPRFKNNKHKDKDKDKESIKTKDKEKTLLNALKKNKDKKVAPIVVNEQTTTGSMMIEADAKTNTITNTQYEKNCLNLDSEVQKLDLNKMDINTNNESNMFIKLKVTATGTTPTVAK